MIGNKPVLLVEDDAVDRMTVQRVFKHNKITNPLVIAKHGEDALAYLERQGEYSEVTAPLPCLILLDIHMPVMNGIELLQELKGHAVFRRIPTVVLTTSNADQDRLAAYDLSVAGYIVKPVELRAFIEATRILDLYWTLSEGPPS